MPQITLTDETFARLQQIAKPLVDTPESVIRRLVDEVLAGANGSDPQPRAKIRRLNPDRPANLTHSRVISARIDGEEISRPNWNKLMRIIHRLAGERLGGFEEVRRQTSANVRPGKHEDQGFYYLPDVEFSVQGQEANLAWQHTLKLARALKTPVQITLEWRDREDAAHPGEQAELAWEPEA